MGVFVMRRMLSLLLSLVLIFGMTGNATAASAGGQEIDTILTNNAVLFAGDISVNGQKVAAPKDALSIDGIRNNLLGMLPEDTETKNSLSLSGGSVTVLTM